MGVAYRPADGWAVRVSGGVLNSANQMNDLTMSSDPEQRASIPFAADPQNPTALTLDNPFPIALEAAVAPPFNVVYIPPDRVNAHNIQWCASVQQQLSESTAFELAHVSQASQLDNSRSPNDALPGTGAFQPRGLSPNTGAFQFAELKYGDSGRNTLRQPSMKVWDIGFQFRWEAGLTIASYNLR